MRIRVLLLTQWFDPEPTFKGMIFARELVRQGFDVEVLTGFPNYPRGRLYPGYRIKGLQRECHEGVRVTRVPLYPSHDHSAIRRVLNYLSFAASSLVYGLWAGRRVDVVYVYHPPLTVGITASLIRLVWGVRMVCDIQDMWPDTLRATGMIKSPQVLEIVDRFCKWVYKQADAIVVLSPGFKRLLLDRGVPESKINVIYNWADESALTSPVGDLPPEFPGEDQFRIVFAGNMGKAQALEIVLDAAELLQRDGEKIRFVLVGGGVEVDRLRRCATERRLRNVVFLPSMPMSEIGTLLKAADALLVHLRSDPLFEITIPSKTQAYMVAGKPIIMGVDGDAAELILQSGGGVVAKSGNAEALASAAKQLASLGDEERRQMGLKASAYYRENLALEVGAAKFGEIFRHFFSSERDDNKAQL